MLCNIRYITRVTIGLAKEVVIIPPKGFITKDKILQAALNIVREEGIDSLSARRIAEELACSTRPIYHVYENMQQLEDETIQYIIKYAVTKIRSFKQKEHPYLNMGLGYLDFAKHEKMLFRVLFLSGKTDFDFTNDKYPFFDFDAQELKLMRMDVTQNGFDTALNSLNDGQLKKITMIIWMYIHGIATLIAANSVAISQQEIENRLSELFNILLSHELNKTPD